MANLLEKIEPGIDIGSTAAKTILFKKPDINTTKRISGVFLESQLTASHHTERTRFIMDKMISPHKLTLPAPNGPKKNQLTINPIMFRCAISNKADVLKSHQ